MTDLPPVTTSAIETAVTLAEGKWSIRPDEWVDHDGESPEGWRESVRAVCKQNGIPFEFQRDDEMTIVVNPERPPSDAQLQFSINHMLELRGKRSR